MDSDALLLASLEGLVNRIQGRQQMVVSLFQERLVRFQSQFFRVKDQVLHRLPFTRSFNPVQLAFQLGHLAQTNLGEAACLLMVCLLILQERFNRGVLQ